MNTRRLALMIRAGIPAAALLALPIPSTLNAQGGRGGPPPAAKASAPVDFTGYWTTVITEDWHERMLTPPKGDFGTGAGGAVVLPGGRVVGGGANPAMLGNIPFNAAGGRKALEWDPQKDEAAGEQCKAYGAIGMLRLPTHLRVSWQDDNTLKFETDFGTQTRLIHFPPPMPGMNLSGINMKAGPPPGEAPSYQGYSVGSWITMGGRGGYEPGGSLHVRTTNLKPGYYWKNGMPYTANAVLTEHFRIIDLPESGPWISFSAMVEDPEYLTQPYIVTYQFKKLPDGSKWNPVACAAK
jgi:hypothetical protein